MLSGSAVCSISSIASVTAGGTLLVAGEQRPDQSGFALPDLVSRLGWGVTYTLKPLADEDVIALLACRAQGRGLELPEDTAQFMLRRFPRDLPTLFALFDTLDTASLVEQRRSDDPVRQISSGQQVLARISHHDDEPSLDL